MQKPVVLLEKGKGPLMETLTKDFDQEQGFWQGIRNEKSALKPYPDEVSKNRGGYCTL